MVAFYIAFHTEKPKEMVVENPSPTAGVITAVNEMESDVSPIEVEEEVVEIVAEAEPQYITMDVPSNNGFKSYMDCKYITDITSEQYKFKYDYLNTASGIFSVDGKYVCAVGTYYATEIGTRIDLVMESGEVVECIVGDVKANQHTDSLNRQHSVDGSVVEFIVDTDSLSDKARQMGDVSYADPRLMGEIQAIRVYLEN